jgi:hypothetical protein
MNANDELMIDELCSKFVDIFNNIKECHCRRLSVEAENDKL